MSNEYITADSTRFWIAHDGTDIVHYGEEAVGVHVSTGQPVLETYANRAAWLARLAELGVADPPSEA